MFFHASPKRKQEESAFSHASPKRKREEYAFPCKPEAQARGIRPYFSRSLKTLRTFSTFGDTTAWQ